jgi:3-oxoacyl-[acyl-carrier protein] reductase
MDGKHALVCASSQGLGYAAALELARNGARLTLNSRSEEHLAKAKASIEAELGEACPPIQCIAADLSKKEDIEALWETATAEHPIDVLVSNTGGPPPGTFDNFDDAAWQTAFEQLTLSVVRLWRLALPHMREQKWGRLITITSSSAREPIEGLLLSTTMRAGIAGMVRTVSKEEAPNGITINNVCPNLTDTDRLNDLFAAKASREGMAPEEVRSAMIDNLPRKRLTEPSEFAEVVAFLASPSASALSGLSLAIDGAAGRFLL